MNPSASERGEHGQSKLQESTEQDLGEHGQSKLPESTEQAPGGHREEQKRGSTYSTPRRYHRGMARQCPCGHDGTKLGEDANDTSASHLTCQTPDLAEDRAKQLEIKLEVSMDEIQSIGGEGDESTRG
jgi:hypothetical protein